MSARRTAAALAFWSVVVAVFQMPYWQLRWWPFPLSTVLLLALLVGRYGREAWARMGLRMSLRSALLSLVLCAGLWAGFAFLLVPHVSAEAGIVGQGRAWWVTGLFPFQALNEEIVLGALLLFPLVQRWGRPLGWAIGLALVFAALHFALYRCGMLQTTLAAGTLVALVGVGCYRHAAILAAGHVGYAWALHAAWNMVMFGSSWWTAGGERRLREPEVFDAFLGGRTMALLCAGAAVLALVLLARKGASRRYQASS